MDFYMPTKVCQEKNAVKNHGAEIASFGKKALIVTGKSSSKKNHSLQDVIDVLNENATEYVVFDEVPQNPSVELIMKASEFGRNEGADFVIGIGGGSPMDSAKAIALMIQNRDTDEEILYQNIELRAIPVVEIPTTCGTGSEVTPYAILTRHDKNTKQSISHKIYPELACIDPEYLSAAPESVIKNTAVDALGHMIESYFNSKATDFSRMLCQYGISVWAENISVLLGDEADYEAYDSLMLASCLAGMAITHTGTSIPHGLSYYLTYNKDIPHGKAVGLFLPGYLKVIQKEMPDEVSEVLAMLGFDEIEQFAFLIKQLLGDYEITNEDVKKMTDEIMATPRKLNAVPFKVAREDVEDMAAYFA